MRERCAGGLRSDLCCSGVIKCHDFCAFNPSNKPPPSRKSLQHDVTTVAYHNGPLNELDNIQRIAEWTTYIHQQGDESAALFFFFWHRTTIYSTYVHRKIWSALWNSTMNTLWGDGQIKSQFVPCHFYEGAMYICSHPPDESHFMHSCPERTVSAGSPTRG